VPAMMNKALLLPILGACYDRHPKMMATAALASCSSKNSVAFTWPGDSVLQVTKDQRHTVTECFRLEATVHNRACMSMKGLGLSCLPAVF